MIKKIITIPILYISFGILWGILIFSISLKINCVTNFDYIICGYLIVSCLCSIMAVLLKYTEFSKIRVRNIFLAIWSLLTIFLYLFMSVFILSAPSRHMYKGDSIYRVIQEYPTLKEKPVFSHISDKYDCYWDAATITIRLKNQTKLNNRLFKNCSLKSYKKNPSAYEVSVQYEDNTEIFVVADDYKKVSVNHESYYQTGNTLFALPKEIKNGTIVAKRTSAFMYDGKTGYDIAIRKRE